MHDWFLLCRGAAPRLTGALTTTKSAAHERVFTSLPWRLFGLIYSSQIHQELSLTRPSLRPAPADIMSSGQLQQFNKAWHVCMD